MSQLNLEFPKAKIVSKKALLIEADITYTQMYYTAMDNDEAATFGFFAAPRVERKFVTQVLGVVDTEPDGQEIISRLDPEKHFHRPPYTIEKVVCKLVPVTRYVLENE